MQKQYKLFDERGLYLLVTPSGGRLWRLRYRMGGLEKLLALGMYPDVTLKRAREKRDEARKLIADGIDPSAKRKAERDAPADTSPCCPPTSSSPHHREGFPPSRGLP